MTEVRLDRFGEPTLGEEKGRSDMPQVVNAESRGDPRVGDGAIPDLAPETEIRSRFPRGEV